MQDTDVVCSNPRLLQVNALLRYGHNRVDRGIMIEIQQQINYFWQNLL